MYLEQGKKLETKAEIFSGDRAQLAGFFFLAMLAGLVMWPTVVTLDYMANPEGEGVFSTAFRNAIFSSVPETDGFSFARVGGAIMFAGLASAAWAYIKDKKTSP